MTRRIRTAALLFSVAAGPLLFASAGAQEITVRALIDVPNMDPANLRNPDEATIAANIFSQLLKPNAKTLDPEPDVAKSWDVTPDGLVYTFRLRDDVSFHKNYGRLTAADVKFTFERILDPRTASIYRSDFENVDRIEAVDDQTVKIVMKRPDMAFIRKVVAYRPGYIVSKKAAEELGDKFKGNPIGSGPYAFSSWQSGTKTTLVANENYFRGAPAVKKVNFLVVREDSVSMMAQESSQIDINVYPSFATLDDLKNSDAVKKGRIKYTIEPELVTNFLQFNNCRSPLTDVRVRRAIAHAINRDDLIQVVFAGLVKQARSIIPPQTFAYKDNVTEFEFNQAKARALLADAGFRNGLELNFLIFNGAAPWTDYAPIVQDQLRQVGIKMNIALLDRATVDERLSKGDYDLYAGVAGRPPDPDIVFSSFYHSRSAPNPNTSCYKQADVDAIIDQARAETDVAKRRAMYEAIQERIAQDVPVVPINYRSSLIAINSNIEGYVFNFLVKYDIANLTLKASK